MLNKLFQSKTRVKILTLFFQNPKNSFHIREIARLTYLNVNGVRRELNNLENIGILFFHKEKNLKLFSLNKELTIYNDLKNIFLKTNNLEDIREEIAIDILNDSAINKNIDTAFIYGQCAKENSHVDENLNICIIETTKKDSLNRKLSKKIAKLEEKYLKEINYVIFTKKELKVKKNNAFIHKILNEKKIFIKGGF